MSNTSLQEQSQIVKKLIDKREYQQALTILDNLLEKYPNNKGIKDVHQQVQTKIAASKPATSDSDSASIDDLSDLPPSGKNSIKTTQEISAAVSDFAYDDLPKATKKPETKSIADVATSITQNKTVTDAVETSKKMGGMALTEGRAIADKGARKIKEFMDQSTSAPGEDEFAEERGGSSFFAASFDKFGFYQMGWADTLDGQGQRYAEFNQVFWDKLLQDHALKSRVSHNQLTVKSARRAEDLDTAKDGIVSALIRITRYGSDLYISYRLFMQLPWARTRIIVAAVMTVLGLCSIVFAPAIISLWIFLCIFSWWRFGAPLRWLRGQVSEFDHDDLMAMQITIGKCIEETVEALGIRAKLRDQPAPGGYREVKHI